MQLKPVKRIPALIALIVIVVVCTVRLLHFDFFERLERMTYDMRAREALKFSPVVATNLGFVFIDENSIDFIATNNVLGYKAGLYWPRHIYGRLTQELASQGARAIAFDIIFGELRPDHGPVQMADGSLMESDDFFGLQMQHAGNVVIAAATDKMPPAVFRTNAAALADISIEKDRPDGILRRDRAFRVYRQWHPLFEQAQKEYGLDLDRARIEPRRIVARANGKPIEIALEKDGTFKVADFIGDKLPAGMSPRARPFTEAKIWSMGIVLAAQQLGVDLAHAQVDLKHGRIKLVGPGGVERVIPVDSQGYTYIDWCLLPNQITNQSMQELLVQDRLRLKQAISQSTRTYGSGLTNLWKGKLVVVGSSAVGNDLTDRGATPISEDTLLASKHWNVANSVLTGRFVHRAPLGVELALIALLGIIAAFLTWELPVLPATGLVLLTGIVYVALSVFLYVRVRYWFPLVLPLSGAMLMTYGSLLAWRVMFEQAEVRRIKSIFANFVSPKIMKEVLRLQTLALGGERREVSVLFSDVRGFTQLTDTAQEQAAEFVRKYNLSGEGAETYYAQQTRELFNTVNVYLGLVAETVKSLDGTFDKFIGDCAMAFWGAPTPNPTHAVACVRAAIAAQRAIYNLNQQRTAENQSREAENKARIAAGLKPKPTLPVLLLGCGINTGIATAGLMGSQSEQKNYTVFGREVNLASRLEALSGHGHIFISESTYIYLLRDDPELAETCIPQPPTKIKGLSGVVNIYEVPWQSTDKVRQPAEQSATPAVPQELEKT